MSRPHGNAKVAIFICGGDERPGPRGTDCPNSLHDYPLPSGYGDAAAVAQRRLSRRWSNPKCPDCGLYGWIPSMRDMPATNPPKENP